MSLKNVSAESGDYWQEFSVSESDAEEVTQLAQAYLHILSLDGLRGVVKRALHQRKMEKRIIDSVTVSTQGDLDAWDEDVRRGVVDRPTPKGDAYWQTRTAKDYATFIAMGLVQIVPDRPAA